MRGRVRKIQIGKKEINYPICRGHYCLEIPKNEHPPQRNQNAKPKPLKCLELISEFSRFSGFKVNTHKKIMLTANHSNEQLETEIKAHHLLSLLENKRETLGINLTKHV